jgi:hypothetical protein
MFSDLYYFAGCRGWLGLLGFWPSLAYNRLHSSVPPVSFGAVGVWDGGSFPLSLDPIDL